MNLDNALASALASIHALERPKAKDLIPLIDLTLLDKQATAAEIKALAIKAETHLVAAVCIFPEHLAHIQSAKHIKKATVINFPSGQLAEEQVLYSIEQIMHQNPVDEIDYVFPYQSYLAHQEDEALRHYQAIYTRCKEHGLTFKVILETGALPSTAMIYQLSTDILNIGCDFLKTSTGKIPQGASIPAVFAMLQAIKDRQSTCGIKVSGGVKTTEQALAYMTLAQYMMNHPVDSSCFRIGASSLLDVLTHT